MAEGHAQIDSSLRRRCATGRCPAHGLAWVEDVPVGLTAFGYIAGLWFDASVPAGASRTISWYHITDNPGAGSPDANVARWAAQLDTLDPPAQSR